MKTTTVRNAQHNFAELMRHVQRGEEIHVFKRKVPVARILPFESALPKIRRIDWSDMPARRQELWKDGPPSGAPSNEILNELRGNR
jgi:antitoxin (DNA-binding transcriptional repressor) of toxin-antitoxin stability system